MPTHLPPLRFLLLQPSTMAALVLLALLALRSTTAGEPSERLAGTAAPKPSVIRFGVPAVGIGGRPIVGGSFLSTTHIQGLLEQEFKSDGIRVEWNFFKGAGPAVNEALAGGLLDFTSLGDLPAFIGRSAGLKTRLILTTGSRGNVYLAVPVGSPARTLEDLKGKRLVVHKGTATQLIMSRILAQRGFSESDFRIINLDSVASLPALLSGDIDGLWSGLTLLEHEDAGRVRVIFDSRTDTGRDGKAEIASQGTILVTENFATRHPDLVQRVVNVLVKTADWNSDEANRETLFTLWERSGVAAATYRRSYRGVPLALRQSPLMDGFFLASLAAGAQAALDLKHIRAPVAIDGWIDRSFLDRALAELKLEKRWTAYDAQGAPAP